MRGAHLAFKWGHDGTPDGACWEVDPAGVAKPLELDDHEVRIVVNVQGGLRGFGFKL